MKPINLYILNDEHTTYVVRIIQPGQKFGRTNSLTAEHCLVEFYDTRYDFDPYGQFVSAYRLKTLLDRGEGGLCLDGGVAQWTVTVTNMKKLRTWLELFHLEYELADFAEVKS